MAMRVFHRTASNAATVGFYSLKAIMASNHAYASAFTPMTSSTSSSSIPVFSHSHHHRHYYNHNPGLPINAFSASSQKVSVQPLRQRQVHPSCIQIHTPTCARAFTRTFATNGNDDEENKSKVLAALFKVNVMIARALTRTFATNGNEDEESNTNGHSKFLILSDKSDGLRGDSTLEELKEKNKNNKSKVLAALFDFCKNFMGLTLKDILNLNKRTWDKFSKKYPNILKRDTENMKEDLEEIVNPADPSKLLHEKVLMDDGIKRPVFGFFDINSDYNDRCTQIYANPEISSTTFDPTKKVSLVMGASGSGKSVFAAKSFPQKYFDAFRETKAEDTPDHCVTVFMTYSAICDDKQNEENIKNRVLKYVKKRFAEELGSRYNPTKPVKNLFLCVVIDEVVGKRCEFFMRDDLEFPKEIASTLEEKVVSSEVHVVLAGTGLEKLSRHVDSSVPFSKIRMGDWDVGTFEEICTPFYRNSVAIVKRHPVLLSLLSNARCAYFLTRAIGDCRVLEGTNDNMGFVNAVLHSVAARYKGNNRLASSRDDADLQVIAKGVLTVLKEAAVMKEENNNKNEEDQTWDFIEYDKTIPTWLHSVCDGFLDVNLDRKDGGVALADPNKEYPVGISNALIYLLAVYSGHVGADPQRFEYLTALGEAQMKLVKLKNTYLLPIKIVTSPVQCPGTEIDKINFLNTSSSNVVINADKANFADVYCKLDDGQLRVVQAKFSIDGVQVDLNLSDELAKNGMLESSDEKQSVFLNYLYQNWTATSSDFRNIRTESTMEEGTDTEENKEIRRSTYPASKMVVYPKNKLRGLYTTEEVELTSLDHSHGDEEVKMNITAVFSTNAGKFRILARNGTPISMEITKDDVDINGQLMEGKRIELLSFVKQNGIDLRSDLNWEFEFSFYSCN